MSWLRRNKFCDAIARCLECLSHHIGGSEKHIDELRRALFFCCRWMCLFKCFHINKLQFSRVERYRVEEALSLLRKVPRVFGQRRSLIIISLYLKDLSDSSSGNHRNERDRSRMRRPYLPLGIVSSRCPKRPAERRCRKTCRRHWCGIRGALANEGLAAVRIGWHHRRRHDRCQPGLYRSSRDAMKPAKMRLL